MKSIPIGLATLAGMVAAFATVAAAPSTQSPMPEQMLHVRALLREHRLQPAVLAADSLLARARRELAPNDTTLAAALDLATACRYRVASYDSCDVHLRQALAIRERAGGGDAPTLAPTLIELARIQKIRGRYAQGDTLVARALKLLEDAGWRTGPVYARALTVQGSLEGKRSHFDRAEALCTRAIEVLDAHGGHDHPYMAETLYILGCIQFLQQRLDEAEATLTRCLQLQRGDPLAQASETALTLGVLGDLYAQRAHYDQAVATYEQALQTLERDLAPDHPDIGIALMRLGSLHDRLGQFELAVPALERAVAIHRRVMGNVHPLVATALGMLGGSYAELGRYDAARACFEEAAATLTQLLGPDNPDVTGTMLDLAKLDVARGDYQQGEQLLSSCIARTEQAFGDGTPKAWPAMNSLASVYSEQGRLGAARALFQRVIASMQATAGPDHPDLIAPLINLADLHRNVGRFAVADSLANMAIQIGERAYGPTSSNLIVALQMHASLLGAQGHLDDAASALARGRAMCAAGLPPEHLDLAGLEAEWAELCVARGDLQEAERAARHATQIYVPVLGESHPLTTQAFGRLARVLAARSDRVGARIAFAQAAASRTRFMELVFPHAAEAQKARYVERMPPMDGALLTFALQDGSPAALRDAMEMVLRAKGTVLEAAVQERAFAQCSDDEALRQTAQQYAAVCADVSAFALRAWERAAEASDRTRMEALLARKDSLEAVLSAHCPRAPAPARSGASRARSGAQGSTALVDQVAATLGPRALLCEIVRYSPYRFAGTGFDRDRHEPARYLALTLDARGQVAAADLHEAASLDSLVLAARQQLGDALQEAYSPLLPALEQRLGAVTQQLYARLIAPLFPRLSEKAQLIVSPDGQVGLLPFEVLQRPQGDYLIEHFTVDYVTTGRDLLASPAAGAGASPTSGRSAAGDRALVVCDPQFDASAPAANALVDVVSVASPAPSAQAVADRGGPGPGKGPGTFARRCPTPEFAPLRFARAEADAVSQALQRQGHLQVQTWTGAQAQEQALKSLRWAPRVLHIGTHGFFCPRSVSGENDDDPDLPYGVNDPLLRAGLALAGANTPRGDDADEDDGLLTAVEISTLDLFGTDLVTLSACDTGVGEVWSGEGVYGLRRAFQAAGARTLLMSQWPVPDRETSQLIADFYRTWLGGLSKRDALRDAELRALERARRERGCGHPVLWGAFVLVGAAD